MVEDGRGGPGRETGTVGVPNSPGFEETGWLRPRWVDTIAVARTSPLLCPATGRALARIAAVALDSNVIVMPAK